MKKWLATIFAGDSEAREVIETLFKRKEVTKDFQFSEEVSDLLKAIMQKATSNRIHSFFASITKCESFQKPRDLTC